MIPGMGAGMDPRQMSMMMKKLGIDVRELDDVQSVTVRTATKDYVFDKASVSIMKAQGVETWQLSGKPRIVERAGPPSPPATSLAKTAAPTATPTTPAAPQPVDIPDEDVALVAAETGRTPTEARAALVATQGDLAEAIVRLQG